MGYATSKALSGGLSGAAKGAAIGSIIPGLGTLAGGGIGLLTGLFGGLFGGKGKEEQAANQRAAQIASLNLKQKMAEDQRLANVGIGSSILKGLGAGTGHYGGRVDMSNFALDPALVAKLSKERTYDFSKAVPDQMAGAGSSALGDFFSSIPSTAASLVPYIPQTPGIGGSAGMTGEAAGPPASQVQGGDQDWFSKYVKPEEPGAEG